MESVVVAEQVMTELMGNREALTCHGLRLVHGDHRPVLKLKDGSGECISKGFGDNTHAAELGYASGVYRRAFGFSCSEQLLGCAVRIGSADGDPCTLHRHFLSDIDHPFEFPAELALIKFGRLCSQNRTQRFKFPRSRQEARYVFPESTGQLH